MRHRQDGRQEVCWCLKIECLALHVSEAKYDCLSIFEEHDDLARSRIFRLIDLNSIRIVTIVISIHIVTVKRSGNARRTSTIIDYGIVDTTVILDWIIRSCVGDEI